MGREKNNTASYDIDRMTLFWKRLAALTGIFLLSIFIGVSAVHATPLSSNGRLSVKSGKIVNSSGKTYVLKGVSTHGIAWYPQYVSKATFKDLRNNWGVNTIRLAMYTAEYNGYCTGGNKADLINLVDKGVTYATELGMYVIIDWHILSDGNPQTYKSQAKAFFKRMAYKYRNYKNVIYEICNEPNGGTDWATIKSYAKTIIKTIRTYDKNAIIIVGTPTWSQDVDQAQASPITGYSNIAYAFHFYAGTHQADMRNKLENVLKKNFPVVVTEFGITDASGNGAVNKSQGNAWIKLLNTYGTGRVCWNLSNKSESSALLKSTVSKTSGFTWSNLSDQGKWLVKTYKGKLYTAAAAAAASTASTGTSTTTASAASSTSAAGTPANITKSTAYRRTSTGSRKVTAYLRRVNYWQSGSYYYTQYTLTLKNYGAATSSWKVTAKFGQNVILDQGWCGTFTGKNNYLVIQPASWNNIISKGATTEIGFILKANKLQTLTGLGIAAS